MIHVDISDMPSYETLGMNRRLTDDQQAVSFASFGQANYPSGQQIYPGANGYYSGPQYQANMGASPYYPQQQAPQYTYGQSYYAPQPQPMYQQPLVGPAPQFYQGSGLGAPPAFQQPNSSPYNPVSYGTSPNPAFQYMAQNPQYFQNNPYMQIQDVTYTIPPINPGGSEYLPPIGYEDEIDQMQLDYWREVQEQHGIAAAKRMQHRNKFERDDTFYGGIYNTNYYNTGYSVDYVNTNAIDYKYRNRLNKMQEEARERRKKLNIHLAKLAFNYLGMEYDEKALVEAYTGKTVTVPGITTLDLYKQQRFNNLVPFDNSNWYRQKDAEVTREFRKHVGEHDNMEEFFENIGLVAIDDALKEEDERRRSLLGTSYDTSSYDTLIREKSMKVYAHDHGFAVDQFQQYGMMVEQVENLKSELRNLDNFPTLKQFAHFSDDGTLHINYSYEPPKNEVIVDENRSKYDAEKNRFRSFLETIPESIVSEMKNMDSV